MNIAMQACPGAVLHKDLSKKLRNKGPSLTKLKTRLNKSMASFCVACDINPPIRLYFQSSEPDISNVGIHLACALTESTTSSSGYLSLPDLKNVLANASEVLSRTDSSQLDISSSLHERRSPSPGLFGLLVKKIRLRYALGIAALLLIMVAYLGYRGLLHPSRSIEPQLPTELAEKSSTPEQAKEVSVVQLSSERQQELAGKVYDVAKILQSSTATPEDKKLARDSLIVYGEEIVPVIVEFTANHVDINQVNSFDPDFLPQARKVILDSGQVVDPLFYVTMRIIRDNATPYLDEYLRDLFSDYKSTPGKNKQALVAGYYLWKFARKNLREQLLTILSETVPSKWDPVNKLMLRAYLASGREGYVLKERVSEQVKIEDEGSFSRLAYLGVDALGYEKMRNARTLVTHLNMMCYKSLVQIEESNGIETTTFMYPEVKAYLGPSRSTYLYGFDFYRVPVVNLVISNALVGKFDFSGARLTRLLVEYSTFIECNFSQATVIGAAIRGYGPEEIRFIGCDLGKTVIGRSLLARLRFAKCDFNGASLNSCLLAGAIFESCNLDQVKFLGGILLNTHFGDNTGVGLTVSDVIVDAPTLNSLLKCSAIDETKIEIEEIDVGSIALENNSYTGDELESPSPEVELRRAWQLQSAMLQNSEREVLKSHIEKQRMYILNRQVLTRSPQAPATTEDTNQSDRVAPK